MFDLDAIDFWRRSRHRSDQSLALAEQNTQPSRPVRRFRGKSSMVVKVKLEGLKVYEARGLWYVYRRSTGEPLIKGFKGSREDLDKKLADPDFIQTYNRPRLQMRRAADFSIETVGRLHPLVHKRRHRSSTPSSGLTIPATLKAAIRNGPSSQSRLPPGITLRPSITCGLNSICRSPGDHPARPL